MIKKVFTLIEMIIVLLILSITIISILILLTKSISFSERTKKIAIVTNITREGVEAIYNIRNTNWVKYAGKKDQCWIKQNPLNDEGASGCENDSWITSGYYVILSAYSGINRYWYVSGVNQIFDINNFSSLQIYKLCNNNGFWEACPNNVLTDKDIAQGRFFRGLRVIGLKDKQNNNYINCDNGEDCGSYKALELQFCVEGVYVAQDKSKITLCSIITNFKK